jgi:hypothetical protein
VAGSGTALAFNVKENTTLHHYKDSFLKAVWGIILVHREYHTNPQIENTRLLTVEGGGAYCYHSVLKG